VNTRPLSAIGKTSANARSRLERLCKNRLKKRSRSAKEIQRNESIEDDDSSTLGEVAVDSLAARLKSAIWLKGNIYDDLVEGVVKVKMSNMDLRETVGLQQEEIRALQRLASKHHAGREKVRAEAMNTECKSEILERKLIKVQKKAERKAHKYVNAKLDVEEVREDLERAKSVIAKLEERNRNLLRDNISQDFVSCTPA
jgi:hypothetical protein